MKIDWRRALHREETATVAAIFLAFRGHRHGRSTDLRYLPSNLFAKAQCVEN